MAIALFWVVTGPVQWGLHGALLVGVVAGTIAFQRWENQTWTLTWDDAGLALPDGRIPWERVRSLRAERLVYLSVLKAPLGELAVLVVELDGGPRAFATREPLESLERLVTELRATRV